MTVPRRTLLAMFLALLAGGLLGFAVGHYVDPAQPNTDTTNLKYCYHSVVNSNSVPYPFNQFFHGDNGTYIVYVCRIGP